MGRINVTFPIFADSNVQLPNVAAASYEEAMPDQITAMQLHAGADRRLPVAGTFRQLTRQQCVSPRVGLAIATSWSSLAYLQLHRLVNLPG